MTTTNNTLANMNNTTANNAATIDRATVRASALRRSFSRSYMENGEKYVITAIVSLDDDCNNLHFDWSVTANIKRIARNGRRVDFGGGCCHEQILKHFPKLAPFVALHLASWDGVPMYAVENGYYFAQTGPEKLPGALRVTPEEAAQLCAATDKAYFKHLLFALGIVDRWHNEAAAAVAQLEELTGRKWANPYPVEVERFRLNYTPEERAEIDERIKAGYYTPEALKERKEDEKCAAIEKQRAEIERHAAALIQKATDEKNVLLFILAAGLPVDNVIYYDHRKAAVFNWKTWADKITPEELAKLDAPGLDRSQLPEGLKFEIETKK